MCDSCNYGIIYPCIFVQKEESSLRRNNIDITFWIIIILLAGVSFRSGALSNPMEWVMDKMLLLPAIVIGISFHEFAHAAVAYKLGDSTPKLQGRVTVNPLSHIDWMGLAALFFVGFGWGVPVEINPRNFKKTRRDEFLVAVAGVTMNLIIAIIFTVICKFAVMFAAQWLFGTTMGMGLWQILVYVIQINLVLMIFNLIPVPPLDGFNIIAQIFGFGQSEIYWKIYSYGSWILIAIIVLGIAGMIISPLVGWMFEMLTLFIF